MAEIVSIKKLRENQNPDIFIETVLNSPARLERMRQSRERMAEQAKREAERRAEEAKRKEEFNFFLAKTGIVLAFIATVGGTLVALVF